MLICPFSKRTHCSNCELNWPIGAALKVCSRQYINIATFAIRPWRGGKSRSRSCDIEFRILRERVTAAGG